MKTISQLALHLALVLLIFWGHGGQLDGAVLDVRLLDLGHQALTHARTLDRLARLLHLVLV